MNRSRGSAPRACSSHRPVVAVPASMRRLGPTPLCAPRSQMGLHAYSRHLRAATMHLAYPSGHTRICCA
eukprot:14936338-Alexandrium_andersonii.AAC.1